MSTNIGNASPNLCAHFQNQVNRHPDRVALRTADGTVEITWASYGSQVRDLAAGLSGLGIRHGDRVGLMLSNRPEFHIIDAAAMHLGAVGFSIYNTSATDQIAYVLSNAAPSVVFCEAQYLTRLSEACAIAGVTKIICIDGHGALTLDDVLSAREDGFDFVDSWQRIQGEDVLTLIYTSGTTGDPKGVELTHNNLLYQLEIAPQMTSGLADGRVLSYLPDAHLINRWLCQYAPMRYGTTVTDVADPKTLLDTLAAVRPTLFAAVPMLWYKVKARVEESLKTESGLRASVARWAVETGRSQARALIDERRLSTRERISYQIADRLVLGRVREQLGMDQLAAAVSGAAPIDLAVIEYMLALGIPVLEAWGMSETSAVSTANPESAPRFGSVGKALPGTELRLAEDGEILVRGPGVMRGYRNDPARTAEALDPDGWIHTGDIGVLDAEGYLQVIDRKKELIINSAGKNMSPSNIEGAVRASSGLIGGVAVIGDRRPFVSALITLDPESAQQYAQQHGLPHQDVESLSQDPQILAAISQAIEAANLRLSRVESVRSWTLLPIAWLPGGEELTPTMKLKRNSITTKYDREISAMYAPKGN